MSTMDSSTQEHEARVLAHVWGMAVGHSSSFGLKAIVKLGIPDILADSGQAMTLKEIGDKLPGSNVQLEMLARLMNFMVIKEIFDAEDIDGERRYKINNNSRLITMSKFGGLVLVQNEIVTSGWHHIHESVLHGGKNPFERAQGRQVWEYMGENLEFCNLFNNAVVAMSNVTMDAVLGAYRGFGEIEGTLVDVGGGLGTDVGRVVAAYPRVEGINLELPHVINIAPKIQGVEQVAGDMFRSIPPANAILFKAVLHDFDDELALVALRNCYQALPKGGKVMIVDIVMDPQDGPFEVLKHAFDLVLLALTSGGRERTRAQWNQLLSNSNFEGINVVNLPNCLHAVVEAYKP